MNRDIQNADLIIFDCDGVLVDSEPISNRVMAEHITRLGWPLDAAESIRQFKGGHMSQIIKRVSCHVGHDVGQDWLVDFNADQLAALEKDIQPIPGVRRVIKDALAAGKKICVASQARKRKMDVTLGATKLMSFFGDNIFSAHDVARPKPFPDLFLHAANRLEIPKENCFVIEDSRSGVKAALAAEMSVIGYDPDNTGMLALDPKVRIIRSMDEIKFK